jgi:hypothetical protein
MALILLANKGLSDEDSQLKVIENLEVYDPSSHRKIEQQNVLFGSTGTLVESRRVIRS